MSQIEEMVKTSPDTELSRLINRYKEAQAQIDAAPTHDWRLFDQRGKIMREIGDSYGGWFEDKFGRRLPKIFREQGLENFGLPLNPTRRGGDRPKSPIEHANTRRELNEAIRGREDREVRQRKKKLSASEQAMADLFDDEE